MLTCQEHIVTRFDALVLRLSTGHLLHSVQTQLVVPFVDASILYI